MKYLVSILLLFFVSPLSGQERHRYLILRHCTAKPAPVDTTAKVFRTADGKAFLFANSDTLKVR